MSHFVKEIDAQDFVDLPQQKDGTVLVLDIWAPWCKPCLAIAPYYEEVAQTLNGKAEFFKMNVDNNREFAISNGVRGVPTFLVFKNGVIIDRITGDQIQGNNELIECISQHL